MSIGTVQKQVRKSLGLRQIAVANAARMPQARLSLIENGWVKPRPDEVQRIEDALKMLAQKRS